MKSLKQIWEEKGKLYTTPLTGSPLYQESDIIDWLQQKRIEKYGDGVGHDGHHCKICTIATLFDELLGLN